MLTEDDKKSIALVIGSFAEAELISESTEHLHKYLGIEPEEVTDEMSAEIQAAVKTWLIQVWLKEFDDLPL